MWMEAQVAGPCVQHRVHAEQRAETPWVGAEGEQGLRDRFEERVEQRLAVAQGQRPELGRQGKHDVKSWGGDPSHCSFPELWRKVA